ncbi:MAG TPA: SCE4755 family polysaccharide monooxygenase-like protein [Kofleriaceae bacterium]|nr:SCE4755 family polysaccharide monooxygenase-like protein [Kofleriaceae bacterium]
MRRGRTSITMAAAGLLVAASSTALAHVQLRAPLQRTEGQKTGPCGGAPRGDTVCTFRPGQTIRIAFDETVEHPGHFRVAFDSSGNDFSDPIDPDGPLDNDQGMVVCGNDIPDRNANVDGQRYTLDVTLPDMECDDCTLQLIQVMSTSPPYSSGELYWQCADIVLSADAPETPDPNCVAPAEEPATDDPITCPTVLEQGGGGDGADAGPGEGPAAGGDAGVGEEDEDARVGAAGGCAAAGGGASAAALLALVALTGYAARRRRR